MTSTGVGPGAETWHVSGDLLELWIHGKAHSVVSASIELHLTRCRICRDAVAIRVPREPLDTIWGGVLNVVEVPRRPWLERGLVRVGISESDAYLVATAPSLRWAWFSGLGAVLVFALLAAVATGPTRMAALFLLIAPLAPIIGVSWAYGPESNPSHELTTAAPYSQARLVLLRAIAVMAACIPLTVLVGLLMPIPTWVAAAWLLPALGFVAVVLAAGTWVEPAPAAGTVAVGWATALLFALLNNEPYSLLSTPALAGYVVLVLFASAVFAIRVRRTTHVWGI